MVIAFSAALWQFGYAMELASESQSAKLLWAKLEYPAIVTLPVAWLALTWQFTGRGSLVTLRNMVLLSVVPVTTVVLAWTNESHGLIWSSISVQSYDNLSVLVLGHGAAFWVHTAYSYLTITAGIVYLAAVLFHSHRAYIEQAGALLVSVLAPWVSNWLYAAAVSLDPPVDPTPFGFLISVAVLAWALYRLRLFAILPVARKAILSEIETGVIVLDTLDRVADCNPAAQRILGVQAADTVTHPIAEVWPEGLDLVHRSDGGATVRDDLTFSHDGSLRSYDVTVSSFDDSAGRTAGRIITLHDITDRKRAEEDLRVLQQRLTRVQEEERRHLSHELHDEIGQELTGLKYLLEITRRNAQLQAGVAIDEAIESTERMIDKTRDLSLSLRPAMLDDLGLVPALAWLTTRYLEHGGVSVSFTHYGIDERLDPDVETAVYRVVQECLTNVARHAHTTRADVVVRAEGGILNLAIRDSGLGFDVESLRDPSTTGLAGMKERVNLLNGTFEVVSAPGEGGGTEITVELPVPTTAHSTSP